MDSYKEADKRMNKVLEHTASALNRLQVGKANPELVEQLMINYHDAQLPMSQVATISALDFSTLQIRPWDQSIISDIEKAITNSNLGLTPQNKGDAIILRIPPLSEERRIQVLKACKQEIERGRIGIRNVRKEINEQIKRDTNRSEDEIKTGMKRIQEHTDQCMKQLDTLLAQKEKSIMQI